MAFREGDLHQPRQLPVESAAGRVCQMKENRALSPVLLYEVAVNLEISFIWYVGSTARAGGARPAIEPGYSAASSPRRASPGAAYTEVASISARPSSSSIFRRRLRLTRVTTVPTLPARPVRPERCR